MRVEVPDRLKPDFHALASILGDLFPTGQVILGGGMLLESSWDHRESTDIDLFISDSDMAHALQGGHQVIHEFFERLDRTSLNLNRDESRIRRISCFIKGESDAGVEWTFLSTPTEGPGPNGPISIEGTGIRAATFTEIFMGKLQAGPSTPTRCRRLTASNPCRFGTASTSPCWPPRPPPFLRQS